MQLATFSNGTFCDSATNYVYINCNNPTTSCVAYSHFIITQDTLNPVSGQYYAYTNSSTTGNASYLWDFGDGTTSTQQYPLHQYAVPGQYVVCLTINGSYTSALGTATCTDTYCDSSSVHRMAAGFQMYHLVVVPQTVTSIKQTEKEIGLNAFPNPITDELTIESTTTNDSQITYMLVDALGRIVLTGVLNDSKTTINTSNLEKGFYNLSISNEKRSSLKTIKLVK
jgi:PKD repeat protein